MISSDVLNVFGTSGKLMLTELCVVMVTQFYGIDADGKVHML
jgi:hypothetical protein